MSRGYSERMTPAEAAALLGVSGDAAPEEILRAFRRRARATHPDLLGQAPTPEVAAAEKRFVQVLAARDVLLKGAAQRAAAAAGAGAGAQSAARGTQAQGPGRWSVR
jgi:DnaJ-class molecular chaperone